MIEIGVIKNSNSPAVHYYRSVGVFPLLQRETQRSLRFHYIDGNSRVMWHDIYPHDVIFVDRPVDEKALNIINEARMMNKKVWIDLDDHLFAIPRANLARRYYNQGHNRETCKACIQLADILTVTTPFLAEEYRKLQKNIVVIPNAWDDYNFKFQAVEPIGSPIKVTWRGSNTHAGDLYDVRKVIAPLMRSGGGFDWTFRGYDPFFLPIEEDKYFSFGSLFKYFWDFYRSKPDFLFVPLAVDDFNKSKSNIAWIEATIAGAVVIAPYGLPEFSRPGILRYKDNRQLSELFARIKAGKIDKESLVAQSRKALEKVRLSEMNVKRLDVIKRLLGIREQAPKKEAEVVTLNGE